MMLWLALGFALTTEAFTPDAFVQMALDCVHREYPNKIAHVMASDEDVKPPRELYPAFYGCYDWHSSVHGHWQLARYLRAGSGPLAESAATRLARSITPANIAQEVEYLRQPGRASFERPYGLAWLFQLHAELVEGDSALATALQPLVDEARARVVDWLPKLDYPIRTGEHSQTAFAFGLMLDWADGVGDAEFAQLLRATSRRLYLADTACPLAYEPSGQDFLSPCLAEADLMRRVLKPDAYASWLAAFMPGLEAQDWLPVAKVSDRSDPKLAHLDGLNLSRAWMLEGIASGLPARNAMRPALDAAAAHHKQAGLLGIASGHYEGQHWLGSFAMYLVTRRGIR